MKILFLHGWQSVPGGVKPTYLARHGHEVINPKLPDEDFNMAVKIAQAEFDKHQPQVVVGSSRGGAVAMNIDSGEARLVLLCPAWKKWGTARTVKPGTVILHSRADDVVRFADSEELVRNSALPVSALIEVGNDHRLADPEPLEAMLKACESLPPIFGGIDISSDMSKCAIAIGEASLTPTNAPSLRVNLDESAEEGQDDWNLPTVATLLRYLEIRCKAERRKAIVAIDIPFGYPLEFRDYLSIHPLQTRNRTNRLPLVDDLVFRTCEKHLKRSLFAFDSWIGSTSRQGLWRYYQSLKTTFFSDSDPKRNNGRNKDGSVKGSPLWTTNPLCTVGDKFARAIARWIRLACDLDARLVGPSVWSIGKDVYLFECYPLASLVSSGLWHPDLKSKERGRTTRTAAYDLLRRARLVFPGETTSSDRQCKDSWGKVETVNENGSDVTASDHTFDALICTLTAWWCGRSIASRYRISGFGDYLKPPLAETAEDCFFGVDGSTLDEGEGSIYYPRMPVSLLDPVC